MASSANVISSSNSLRTARIALALGFLCAPLCMHAQDFNQWLPVRDVDLRIVPGSALDFSALVDSPASLQQRIGLNSEGRLAQASGKGERQRFLCAPLVYSGPHGGFPSKVESDELAKQLRLHGYGLARLHLVDAALMKGRKKDFDYDPEELDRFHYLLAALKKQGIRWMIDAATSWNGAYGDVGSRFNRGEHRLKLSVHYDEESQAHWKKMVATILNVKNPYTNTVILDDPALAVLTLFNELGVNYGAKKNYPPELKARFKAWKQAQGIRADRDGEGRDDDDGPQRLEISSRAALMQRFLTETEQATAKWMSDYVRGLGYKGLITAYNNGKSIQSAAARGAMDVVSLHGYHDIPEEHARPGSEQEADSAIGVELAYVQYFGIHRYLDRGFIVDEYNHAYWNPWRREAGITLPAYAALQDWDAICRYSNPVQLRYSKDSNRRARSLTPFGVGLDPIARAGETLAALLYARGDVSTARQRVPIVGSSEFFNGPASAVNAMPVSISRLSLVTGTGLVNESRSQAAIRADAADSQTKTRWYAGALSRNEEGWRKNLRQLRTSGLLPEENRSTPDGQVFESDTGELLLETRAKTMRVATARTEAFVFADKLPAAATHLKIEKADVPAMVSVSTIDGKALKESRRMLLIIATDAVNTGDRFSQDRKRLEALGRLPAIIQPIKLTLLLRGLNANEFTLHALNLAGERVESLATTSNPDGLNFTIDTAALRNGPTTFFELVAR
jgi:hypothetical protein